MLPSIVEIAEREGLTFNPRSLNQKEVLCKCHFCNADSNNNKYYLSLNTHDNVYKCWYCGVKGGVLDFESRLTNTPYQVIKEKYFPKKRKKSHAAYNLNNHQLKKIGWAEFKRQSLEGFKLKRDEVKREWEMYEEKELRKLFAMLMIVAHIECSEERRQRDLTMLMQFAEKTEIYLCFSKLMEQFSLDFNERLQWAVEGTEIARIAWKASIQEFDFDMEKALIRVLFINFRYLDNEDKDKNENDGVSAPNLAAAN